MTRSDRVAILVIVAMMFSGLGIAAGAVVSEQPDCSGPHALRFARCADHQSSMSLVREPVRDSCQEDDWCWSALIDGNHQGHYLMRR